MQIMVSRTAPVKATVTPVGRVDADSWSHLKLALQELVADDVLRIVVALESVPPDSP